ncbi:MAG: MetQ/NlpA family ABC transporter substrate-binding protein [Liquorilactobacillus nagelii]|jgi:D-methionine transport system substrate-binding protein|uniref:Lipoprotein n=1 Tax=Liquorilactobacillus nagelii TaxID=82688 RepID=A0A3Q8CBL7_9LACO|nr:MetQ/NlpA family ABC transporter substrate-binding protein [Liquorilactobacillus nagelii]AUJ31738.1 ABC transporter substrate-binding protein [Liquorilactobacillus nagelii]KRL41331.1 D-methionine ABC transporter binding protein [Liquorilactobacillus nagelii DSM 13675]MCC7615890.1 ABC transporter substrate-binding protein [Liquorilactobacillus nagelii]MCI1700751.1 MetQ/NlpA family ABC transporter substrate-binding protein [Liquorilactobacillus nagelii]MCP9314197.1 MetQ/NlpA family ABC transp
MKKKNLIIWAIVIVVILVAGYFSFGGHKSAQNKTVTVGIMSGEKQEDAIWKSVATTAKDKYNITLKFKKFTDYSQPNKALAEGDVDLNSFQHYAFLKAWNKANKTKLVPIGRTFITPIRLYSNKVKNVKDIADGSVIAVPNDATNESRALYLLKNAGLITLKKDTDLATVKSIAKNPKHLQIKELDASQTARSLSDVTAAVINTNYAQAAKINYKSAIYVEPVNKDSEQWINIIVANKKDKNKQEYKDVVKAYQTAKTKQAIQKEYGTAEIPAWNIKLK